MSGFFNFMTLLLIAVVIDFHGTRIFKLLNGEADNGDAQPDKGSK